MRCAIASFAGAFVVWLAGCASSDAPGAQNSPSDHALQREAASLKSQPGTHGTLPDLDQFRHVRSNDGQFELYVRTHPQDIPLNESFEMTLVIVLNDEAGPPQVVSADAAMPHHGHGMNHLPTVTQRTDREFVVRDMLLHMPGYWELYVDVERAGITERAQWSIELD